MDQVQEELEQAKKAVWTRGAAGLNVDMNLMELANTVKDCYACNARQRWSLQAKALDQ